MTEPTSPLAPLDELIAELRQKAEYPTVGPQHTRIIPVRLLLAAADALALRSETGILRAVTGTLRAVLEKWTGDGHLQTFEDRERFRKEALLALKKAARQMEYVIASTKTDAAVPCVEVPLELTQDMAMAMENAEPPHNCSIREYHQSMWDAAIRCYERKGE